ncbi:MAG: hypothetical protein WC209_14455 [Ignavibacteriaceae bacterium]|jgi:hypothetical protein
MNEILKTIKGKGFWRILIRPQIFDKDRIQKLVDLRRIVEESEVKLRGWYYPHYDYKNIINGNDFIESFIDYGAHKEFWRYFQSGQFIHYRTMREDYEIDISKRKPLSVKEPSPSNKYLEIIITIYTITEIFEFASRLANKNLLAPSFEISITLNDILDRQLMFYEEGRDLWSDYRCKLENLEYKNEFASIDFINNYKELAIKATYWFFERFNWTSCSIGLLQEEQNKLYQRRI